MSEIFPEAVVPEDAEDAVNLMDPDALEGDDVTEDDHEAWEEDTDGISE